MKIKTAVLLPDIHYPYHNEGCLKVIRKFLKDAKPDYLIYMGDQMDFKCISFFTKNDLRAREGTRLKKEYEGFQKILDKFEEVVPKSCKKVYLMGNHEARVDRAIAEEPRLEGFWEPENNLNLKDYKIVPYNKVYKLGKLHLIHGYYYNKYHAAKTVDVFERNVCYCHVHDFASHTKITPQDREYHTAWSLGALCDLNPEYMKGRPSNWVHGFGVVYLKPNGNFNLYPVIITNNKFLYGGKEYK